MSAFDAHFAPGDSVSRVFTNPFTSPPQDLGSPTGFSDTLGLVVQFTTAPAVLSAAVDIKPGSWPNSIRPATRGVIPVAILTTSAFDATSVNGATVLFGRTGSEAAPSHVALEDVDGDGDFDMILQFRISDTGVRCGDTVMTVTGLTITGRAFQGSDAIRTVGCF